MRTKIFPRRQMTKSNMPCQMHWLKSTAWATIINLTKKRFTWAHFINGNCSWFLRFCLGLSSNCTWTCYCAKQVKWMMLANTKLPFIYHLLWKEFFTHVLTYIWQRSLRICWKIWTFSRENAYTLKHKILYMIEKFMDPLKLKLGPQL